MTTFQPTAEQQRALDLFKTGDPLVIQAGAGTGKTSTLLLLAADDPRRGQYLAFNKAIVEDAKAKMPSRVACNTAHSLAFRAVGKKYAHRLKSGRMRSEDVAKRLGIGALEISTSAGRKRLAPGFLAGYVMRAAGRFCQSADETPGLVHFPYLDGIDLPTDDGRRTYDNNREVQAALVAPLRAAWADLSSRDGALRFSHDAYLKLWQLSDPVLGADYVLLDEAQDTNPVLLDVFWKQAEHAQLVAVGDDCQAIYEWRGAVNALAEMGEKGANVTYLTQSFRFGPAVAEVANDTLGRLGAPLRLVGTPTIPSRVEPIDVPDAVLTRTNAEAMRTCLETLAADRKPHLVGGGAELSAFAKAALDLMSGGRTYHPELACFDSWGEVQDYVEHDQQGDELRLLVGLVDEYGPERIISALDRMPAERDADVIISTAHKSKGREWDRVRIASDFPDGEKRDVEPAEWRLIYVAVTRAKLVLDTTALVVLAKRPDETAPLPGLYADEPEVEPADVRAIPTGCPDCGRSDVIRGGIVGAHRCSAVTA